MLVSFGQVPNEMNLFGDFDFKWIFLSLFTDFCQGRSCHQRSLFVDICKYVIDFYSKTFFKKYFYEVVLELHKDPVPNIRLRLCSLLPPLKRLIKLPTDRNLLQQLDLCVRKLLVAEKDRDVQCAIKLVNIYM